tara:strand:- start:3142 stop:5097 length:1956 start_codon:yes stop_codon:yes gene_type:complete
MSLFHKNTLLGVSGSGSVGPVYSDDVFHSFLYEGTGVARSLDVGIDLSAKGGLVWTKNRSSTTNHELVTTKGGTGKALRTNTSDQEASSSASVTAFNNDGYSLGTHNSYNHSGHEYCAWIFRQEPGFFNVVEYSGTGAAQTINHGLGSTPGMIWVKRTDAAGDWQVYHRSLASTEYLVLNSTAAKATGTTRWNSSAASSTQFTVGTDASVNANGGSYIAYVFAHDDQSFGENEDEAIIKCGTYTGGGSTDVSVDLGFEPQWLIVKESSHSGADWVVLDIMRGLSQDSGEYDDSDALLKANTLAAETIDDAVNLNATGFTAMNSSLLNVSSRTYIYMAIRRSHKEPSAGTEVFTADANGLNASAGAKVFEANHQVDLLIARRRNHPSYPTLEGWKWIDRSRGKFQWLDSSRTDGLGEYTTLYGAFDVETGVLGGASAFDASGMFAFMFKRAAKFFDIVTFNPSGTAGYTVKHNLGVVPELIIHKHRGGIPWYIYAEPAGNTKAIQFNGDWLTGSTYWNNTSPTATEYTLGDAVHINNYLGNYVSYLFASLDGVSKIGSYSGTGNDVDVDCGFTAGARFIMIKRLDGSGDWFVWDSARGIATGNDPLTRFNRKNLETTSTDYIDPLSSGFTVTSSAHDALNASGGSYLFFAIA